MSLLEIRNLSVEFETVKGTFRAVDGVDLSIDDADILSIVANPVRANRYRCWR